MPLDQPVHGNDYWQTDHDTRSGAYRMSYHLQLDGMESSRWALKRATRSD